MRVRLVVAYDGTLFCGWQVQPEARTVEGELNAAITRLTGKETAVIGASRTDSGVHSLGNVAVFDTESPIPPEKYEGALNSILPRDVVIQSSEEVDENWHPRKCDCIKTYEYTILNRKKRLPLFNNTAYYYYKELDIEKMREASRFLVGEHDFKSFCSVKTQALTTIRTIYSIEVEEKKISEKDEGRLIVIRVRGNGFLYNMVRIIAGTLIDVGNGRFEPEYVKKMLATCDRTVAGPTAPPQGLMLCRIEYPPQKCGEKGVE